MCRMIMTLLCSMAMFGNLVSAQWMPNIPIETRSLDKIYGAAQAEQCNILNIAAGGDARGQWSGTVQAFEKRFPGISMNLTTDLSKYHDSRIDRDFYAGNESIDIAVLQTLQDFVRWKAQNRLMFYKPQNFSDIVNGEKDLDGAWLPVYLFNFGQFYYDSSKLNESDVPSTYLDLLDPKWKSSIILTYPNDDDAVAYLFSIITSKYGFDWFESFSQQDVQWVRGTATPFILLSQESNNSTSQRTLSFSTAHLNGFSSNILSKIPTDEEYMSWYQTIGIFRSTKCPETAKLFVSWILSDEWQGTMVNTTTTPLNHLNAQSGEQVYTQNYTQSQGFREFMLDRANVEWWKVQFETTLGPAVGVNPNTIY